MPPKGATPRPDETFMDNTCPHCGAKHDAVSKLKGSAVREPDPGSLSLCIKCGEFGMFDEAMKLRKLTDDEMVDAWSYPEVRQVYRAWRQMKDQEPKP